MDRGPTDEQANREADAGVDTRLVEEDAGAAATTPSDVSPSAREWRPSATSAALAIRRPTRSLYCATASFPTNPTSPAVTTSQGRERSRVSPNALSDS